MADALGLLNTWEEDRRCPTCEKRVWNVRLGRYVNSRETVGLVCQTCGRDYGREWYTK